jgi:hypothetical protein
VGMTVDELLRVVSNASKAGHGQARVVIDTDAACYDVHLVDDLSVCLESAENMPDGTAALIISPRAYHGTCASRRSNP